MKSPFPGMDPYLEAHWGDVHTSLITYARELLRPQLPGDLKVRVEESISVQDPDDERSDVYFPDVRIVEKPLSSSPEPAESSSLIDAAYENGGYDDTDYRLDPVPPLSPGDAEWAAGVLRHAQRR